MKTRVLSSLIMLPLLIVVVIGGEVLIAACFLIGLMGVHEFYRGFETTGAKPSRFVAIVSTVALYAVYFYFVYGVINKIDMSHLESIKIVELVLSNTAAYTGWISLVVVMSLLYLFKINEREIRDSLITMGGIFYVVFFSFHVVLVAGHPIYGGAEWLILLTAFGTDIFAYFTGVLIGKHKLCPNISPKKTIEGSIGGIMGSMLLCGIYGWFLMPEIFVHCLIIGFLGGIFSQFGDLTASIFKRKIGIKDYGNLIPGHGGILDRFDSVLFTAPMVYYYLMIITFLNLNI